MNLDREHQGLSISINEPAFFPHAPSGPRFLHFILGGFVLSIALPFGVFYAKQQVFPRVYKKEDLINTNNLMIVAELTSFPTFKEKVAHRKEMITIGLIATITLLTIIVVSFYRYLSGE